MHNQKGVSLIEILVVVAIVAVITGMTIPSYFRLKPTMRVNGAARQIMGDLMWAKMKAVSENNDYVITFGSSTSNFLNNTYNIYDDDDNNFSIVGSDPNELVKTVVISDKYKEVKYGGTTDINGDPLDGKYATFSSGTPSTPVYASFKSTGRPDLSGTIYIMYNDDLIGFGTDTMRAITVSIAGRIKIRKYTGSGWE